MSLEEKLFSMQDKDYRAFSSKLMPGISSDTVIGVRTPQLKSLAKELLKNKEYEGFLSVLPHRYFEENQLHGFIISGLSDYDEVILQLERFLPCVDNWATCDQLRPKIFKKHRNRLIEDIKKWILSSDTYTVRFGVGMLMCHFLDEDFCEEYLRWVSEIRSEEYYINMMLAWYFATALAKQYDKAVLYLENRKLGDMVHNMTIRKASESYRVSDEHKAYLKKLKIKP